MSVRWQFGSKHRDYLYDRERNRAAIAGRGQFPICHHCNQPVTPDQAWDEVHEGAPKALGGKSTGVGHRKCNRADNAQVVTPMVAKAERVHRKFVGIDGPGLGKHRMPCGRRSRWSKGVNGRVHPRLTLAQRAELMRAARAIAPEA